jgi:hypothetical protein
LAARTTSRPRSWIEANDGNGASGGILYAPSLIFTALDNAAANCLWFSDPVISTRATNLPGTKINASGIESR